MTDSPSHWANRFQIAKDRDTVFLRFGEEVVRGEPTVWHSPVRMSVEDAKMLVIGILSKIEAKH